MTDVTTRREQDPASVNCKGNMQRRSYCVTLMALKTNKNLGHGTCEKVLIQILNLDMSHESRPWLDKSTDIVTALQKSMAYTELKTIFHTPEIP